MYNKVEIFFVVKNILQFSNNRVKFHSLLSLIVV